MKKGLVVIGGGTGFIGSHLCSVLRHKKYDVKVISRMPGPNRLTWHEIQQIGLPNNTTSVINLAGQNALDPMKRWTAGFKQNVWNSRVKTTAALRDAIMAMSQKPSTFITISGVGIYKPSYNIEYTEDSRVEPFDFLSKLVVAWENASKLPSNAPCRNIIIRSGVVLGRDGGMIKLLYLPFYLGFGGAIGNGDHYMPWIHVADLAKLFAFAVETPGLQGILNGVAPCPVTNKEFTNAFAKAMHRFSIVPLPKPILNFLLNEERAKMMTEGQIVYPARTQALGFKFVYPTVKEACTELVNSPKHREMESVR